MTLLDMCLAQKWPEKHHSSRELCYVNFGGEGRGQARDGANACPKPVSPSWNGQLPPFRTGPQLTIFGTATKISLIHSTNSCGNLKAAGIHSPRPPSMEGREPGNELTSMKGSESVSWREGEQRCSSLLPWFPFLSYSGHSPSHSICLAAC